MQLKATSTNVIFKVKNKKKDIESLLVETGEQDSILIGEIVAVGPDTKIIIDRRVSDKALGKHEICAYLNRVALLPWADEDHTYYTVKEENIYGILEVE
jgi:hypothetical protein